MTPSTPPREPDEDAWQDHEPGERPDLPAFDDEEIEAALWRQQFERTV